MYAESTVANLYSAFSLR